MDARPVWLVGALLIFAVAPFTIFAIRPTNNQLLDPALDRHLKQPAGCYNDGEGFTRCEAFSL
jgi:Domain of unknown function (DUF1772)